MATTTIRVDPRARHAPTRPQGLADYLAEATADTGLNGDSYVQRELLRSVDRRCPAVA